MRKSEFVLSKRKGCSYTTLFPGLLFFSCNSICLIKEKNYKIILWNYSKKLKIFITFIIVIKKKIINTDNLLGVMCTGEKIK